MSCNFVLGQFFGVHLKVDMHWFCLEFSDGEAVSCEPVSMETQRICGLMHKDEDETCCAHALSVQTFLQSMSPA